MGRIGVRASLLDSVEPIRLSRWQSMGLDGVELVLACEEEFGVSLPDSEVATCTTPGKLIDVICAIIHASDHRECVDQRAFHVLRKALVEEAGVPRRDVRLDTDIRKLLAGKSVPQTWAALRKTAGATTWPALVRPLWMEYGILALTIITFAATINLSITTGFVAAFKARWWLALVCAILVAWLAAWLTRRFCTHVPPEFAPLRRLLIHVEPSPPGNWTRDRVAYKVKAITMAQLGLNDTQYREDADFCRDLGLS